VARIKGLIVFCGVKPKAIAQLTQVSIWTLRDWQSGRRYGEIEPDPNARTFLVDALNIVGMEK
jgi:hypothetical protein